MAYCTKCGTKNEEDALFCKSCGAPIKAPKEAGPEPQYPPSAPGPPPRPRRYDHDRDWDDRCEEDCAGGKGRYMWVWGALIILVGIWIVFEFGLKNISGVPDWLRDFEFWWVIPVLIGVLIIIAGLDMVSRTARYRK